MLEEERRLQESSSSSHTGFAHRPSVSTVRALAATVQDDDLEEEPSTG